MNSGTRAEGATRWPLPLRLLLDLITTVAAMVIYFIAISSAASIWQGSRSTAASVGLNMALIVLFGGIASRLGKRKTLGQSWRGAGFYISDVCTTIFFSSTITLGVVVIVALFLGTMGWLTGA